MDARASSITVKVWQPETPLITWVVASRRVRDWQMRLAEKPSQTGERERSSPMRKMPRVSWSPSRSRALTRSPSAA